AGLLADLEALAVGQEAQLGLVFLPGDEDRPVGDDRRAESIGPGDAEDVLTSLGIVDAEGERSPPGLGIGREGLARDVALGDPALGLDLLDQGGRERLADRVTLSVGGDDLERERLAVEVDVAGGAEANPEAADREDHG